MPHISSRASTISAPFLATQIFAATGSLRRTNERALAQHTLQTYSMDDEFIKFTRPSRCIRYSITTINTHNLDLITIINRAKCIIIVLFRTVIGTMTINLKLLQRLNGNWSIELIVFSLAVFFFSLSLSRASRRNWPWISRSQVYRSLDFC